jgi:hypothetical protein
MNALALPSNVGTSSSDGFRVSTGEPGALTYGPYLTLEGGRYVAGFYVRRVGAAERGNIVLDVYIDGSLLWKSKTLTLQSLFEDLASFVYLPFELSGTTHRVEIRLHVDDGVLIEVQDLVLFNADQRNWSIA